jgi:hypothetical protein
MGPKLLSVTARVKNHGYFYVRVPGHPNITSTGYVYEHRFVMECFIGRFLSPNELVHHKNGKRDDNKISNLELITSSDHTRYHLHAFDSSPVDLVCPFCERTFRRLPSRLANRRGNKNNFCSRSCNIRFNTPKRKGSPVHGTTNCYGYYHCRCSLCREAKRLSVARWRDLKSR